MSSRRAGPAAVALWLYLSASAIVAVIAGRAAVQRVVAARDREPRTRNVGLSLVRPPDAPIRGEAAMFGTSAASLAIEPTTRRVRSAHPRTLHTFRFLRAYPGAPPRVPHGVTADEFRAGTCNECHERGGYSLRFSAYAPVTPHPEMVMCLQCHLGDDSALGSLVPGADPNTRCPLCHGPSGGGARADAAATWPATVWPRVTGRAPERRLPPMPHDLALRENCVACHTGPSAVAEIRTAHADRADCRTCHVAPDRDVESLVPSGQDPGPPSRGPQ